MATAIYSILIFCVLIFIHEFGHFIMAKISKMTVHEFAIGMGPKILGFKKGGTQYTLRILPIGGYVKLEGEDGDSDDPGAFCNKSAFRRFTVLVAGALMNIILGFLCFVIIFSTVEGFTSNKIDTIVENSAFDKAGIRPGDEIVKMVGDKYSTGVHFYDDISFYIQINGNEKTEITFKRDGEKFTKVIAPEYVESEDRKMFGFSPKVIDPGFADVLSFSFWKCVFVIKSVFLSLIWLITGFIPVSEVSGPVGIVKGIGQAASAGWQSVAYFAGFISVNLGVMNLLPIPALDGGRILFLLIEKIRGKKMKAEREGLINFLFLALLMIFMLFITVIDVTKLF